MLQRDSFVTLVHLLYTKCGKLRLSALFLMKCFGGIKEMPYLCSVDGESITLIVTLNFKI